MIFILFFIKPKISNFQKIQNITKTNIFKEFPISKIYKKTHPANLHIQHKTSQTFASPKHFPKHESAPPKHLRNSHPNPAHLHISSQISPREQQSPHEPHLAQSSFLQISKHWQHSSWQLLQFFGNILHRHFTKLPELLTPPLKQLTQVPVQLLIQSKVAPHNSQVQQLVVPNLIPSLQQLHPKKSQFPQIS